MDYNTYKTTAPLGATTLMKAMTNGSVKELFNNKSPQIAQIFIFARNTSNSDDEKKEENRERF